MRIIEKNHKLNGLRVAVIAPFPPMQEGVADYTDALVRSLSKRNPSILVYVLAPKSPSGLPSDPEEYPTSIVVKRLWRRHSLIDRLKILRNIAHERADVVEFQYGPYSAYGGLIGEPFLLLFLLLKIRNIPSLLTLHSLWLPEEAERRIFEDTGSHLLAKLGSTYYSAFMKVFLRMFDRILVSVDFPGGSAVRELNKKFNLPLERIGETVHGVYGDSWKSGDRVSARKQLGLEGYKTILSFGYVRRGKGLEHAIEALRLLGERTEEHVLLVIAGKPNNPQDAAYLVDLKRLTTNLNLHDHVRFDTRYLPKAVVEAYHSAADLVILPYDIRVGSSGPLALAVANGIRVITTAGRTMPSTPPTSLIRFVPPKDPHSLANAMVEAISQSYLEDTAPATRLEDQHSFDKTAEEHAQIYRQLLGRK